MIDDDGCKSGGSSIYMFTLKKELEKKGHLVKTLSSDYNNKEYFNDFSFRGFNTKSLRRVFLYLFNFSSYNSIKKLLKDFNPDIVHLHYIFSQTSPSVLLPLKDIPTVMTLHDGSMVCPLNRLNPSFEICNRSFGGYHCIKCLGKKYFYELIRNKIYKKLLKNIDIFIAPSKNIEEYFNNQEFIKNKLKVIYNGINLLEYSKITKGNDLLYIGTLSKQKGVEYLLKAMLLIIEKFPTAHLNIVGDGEEKNNLEKLTKKLKLEKYVTFSGRIPNKKIGEYYKKATIVVIPSICPESFSLVGLEAMSAGRSVIGTCLGAIPEWLDEGITGYLVKAKNPKQIAEKATQLFSDRKLIEQMGKNTRKKAEQFSIEKHANKIEKIYLKVIKKYKTKGVS